MPPDSDPTNGETPDEAVAVLHGLELEPSGDLPMRVRRGIERRFLGRDLLGFYLTAVTHVALEWLAALLSRVSVHRPPKGG
jgi:hypothetical protein